MIVNFYSDFSYATEYQRTTYSQSERFNLDRVGVIVLAGGQGERLKPLTLNRCKPAISFGGRYSLIDVPISHSLNSGLKNIYVIGQYLAYTLQKHLFQTYSHRGIDVKTIQMIVPEEREGEKVWYKGTADAIRQNLTYFEELDVDYFLILSGDQLYNIDFRDMIDFGRTSNADMVIAAQPVTAKDAKRMGLLQIDHESLILTNFHEKPQEEEILKKYYTDNESLIRMGYQPHQEKNYLGSMGIYFFKRDALFKLLLKDPREDFGKHLITTQMNESSIRTYLYGGYWEDIGTIESYYSANLALTEIGDDSLRGLKCYDESQLIYTRPYYLPGAKFVNTQVHTSLICEGSIIEASEIKHSIIGVRSTIKEGSVIRDSIIIGNEYYERPAVVSKEKIPNPGIGSHCLIQKTIIDENVTIGNNVKLVNQQNHINYESPDQPKIYVKDGIIVIPRGTVIPDGFTF